MLERLEKGIVDEFIKKQSEHYFYALPLDITVTEEIKNQYLDWSKIFLKVKAKRWKIKCNCEQGKGEVQEVSFPTCPYCGHEFCIDDAVTVRRRITSVQTNLLFTPKDREKILEEYKKIEEKATKKNKIHLGGIIFSSSDYMDSYQPSKIVTHLRYFQTYYVREKLDGTNGVDMLRLLLDINVNDDEELFFTDKYDSFSEIIPGKEIKAYKRTKAKGIEEISTFDSFHINKDLFEKEENIVFEGSSSMIDFMFYNEEFSKRTGFINLLSKYDGRISENSLFLLYMYLLSEYPVIELLLKDGHFMLVYGLLEQLRGCWRRGIIRERVDNLSSLLNQTTKGTAALTLPSYIGSFLKEKNAPLNEYMAWASIYELESIGKEVFDAFVASEVYLYLNYYQVLEKLPNIMKYGYTMRQTTKYLMKQFSGEHRNFKVTANLWKDYLEMCELLNVEAARFPKNLQAVHDDMSAAVRAQQNMAFDVKLGMIADQYAGFSSESKYLTVVFPRCTEDFVREGTEQHNCVAGYSHKVHRGDCRVFFVRNIESPEKAYITAECSKDGRLSQIFYRNNQMVSDYKEIEFAKYVCKFIMSKPWEPPENKVMEEVNKRKKS